MEDLCFLDLGIKAVDRSLPKDVKPYFIQMLSALWEKTAVARDMVGNETKFLLSGYLHATSGEIRQGQISKKGHNIILGSDNFY